jgi:hypothetical protein
MQAFIRLHLFTRIVPTLAHGYLTSRQLAPPMTTALAIILQQNSECMVLSSALSICTSLTPGFTDMVPTKQAECLCYSETVFLPTIFDSVVNSCADFARTAAPGAFSAIANLKNFCAMVDDGLLFLP